MNISKKLKLALLSAFCATAMLAGSATVFASEEVECVESTSECIRITLGNETHIYPGDKKESNPSIQ